MAILFARPPLHHVDYFKRPLRTILRYSISSTPPHQHIVARYSPYTLLFSVINPLQEPKAQVNISILMAFVGEGLQPNFGDSAWVFRAHAQ